MQIASYLAVAPDSVMPPSAFVLKRRKQTKTNQAAFRKIQAYTPTQAAADSGAAAVDGGACTAKGHCPLLEPETYAGSTVRRCDTVVRLWPICAIVSCM